MCMHVCAVCVCMCVYVCVCVCVCVCVVCVRLYISTRVYLDTLEIMYTLSLENCKCVCTL